MNDTNPLLEAVEALTKPVRQTRIMETDHDHDWLPLRRTRSKDELKALKEAGEKRPDRTELTGEWWCPWCDLVEATPQRQVPGTKLIRREDACLLDQLEAADFSHRATIGLHRSAEADVDTLTERLAAAQAVIGEAREFVSSDSYRGDDGVVDGDEVLRILSQSPTDALQAHDRQVAAKALTDAADEFESGTVEHDEIKYSSSARLGWTDQSVGDAVMSSGPIMDWLRARAVSLVPSAPEQPEGETRGR